MACDASFANHGGYHAQGLGFWAVEHRADRTLIGFCGLKPGGEDTPIAGSLEIGWMIAVPYWRQGYALEAMQATIDWAWRHRDDDAIVAITARRNVKSRGLMERLGMEHVPEFDFEHPLFTIGDPLRSTVTYRISRP